MAKRIRISSDGGSTWNTLPGNSGSINDEAGEISDTIFGQDYSSIQSGLIGYTIQSNALYKGFAGYVATIKQISGSATTTTGESMSLVSGKTYQIDAASKQIWDRSTAPVIKDNGSAVAAANIESIDYLFGKVTFVSSYTPTTPITCDVDYFGTAVVGKGRTFTLTQTAAEIEDTDFATAQGNSGHMTYDYGLKTVSLEVGGIFAAANGFRAQLIARAETIIDLSPDGGGDAIARGYFKLATRGQEGDVGALETETVKFDLYVPDEDNMQYPFAWEIASGATLNQSVQDALSAWQNKSALKAQYLYDGTNGYQGDVVVTEITLSGGLESMNEFSTSLKISGAMTAVP